MLHYIIGDATDPIKRPAIITHVNNDCNGWGRGFVLALRAKYPASEKAYHEWFATGAPKLGDVQYVQISPDLYVVNMIGQHGVQWQGKIPPIRYPAIERGLEQINARAKAEGFSLHMPRLGAVLAGGEWPVIERIILETMLVETYVYTLENQKDRWPTKYENSASEDDGHPD